MVDATQLPAQAWDSSHDPLEPPPGSFPASHLLTLARNPQFPMRLPPLLLPLLAARLLLGVQLQAAEVLLPTVEILEDHPLVRHPVPILGTGATNPLVVLDPLSKGTALFPEGSIVVSGGDGAWFVSASPALNAYGTGQIRLVLLEGNPPVEVGSVRLLVRVVPVNDPPAIEPVADRRRFVHESFVPVPLRIQDPDGTAEFLKPEVIESTLPQAIIPAIRRTGTNTFELFNPSPQPFTASGILRIRLTARDQSGAQDTSVFQTVIEPAWMNLRTNRGPSVGNLPVGLVDLNRDGIPDLIPASPSSGSPPNQSGPSPAYVLWNTISGAYPATPSSSTPLTESVVVGAWGDFNGDGLPDLARALPPNRIQIWMSTADSQRVVFTSAVASGFSNTTRTRMAVGDLDGDGDHDLVLSTPGSPSTSFTRILLADGPGRFVEKPPGIPGVGGTVTLGDVDNDGDLDLLVLHRPSAGSNIGQPMLLLNDGKGLFSPDVLAFDPGNAVACGLVDYDVDGKLDLWVLSVTSPQRTAVELQLLRGTAAAFTPGWRFEGPHSALDEFRGEPPLPVFADFDQDGLLDVLCAGRHDGDAGWYFHRQVAPGVFIPVARLPQAPSGTSPIAATLDRPGRLDLIAPLANFLLTFSNALPYLNLPPSAPARPRASILRPGLVRLRWDPAADLNQSSGLTYNVRAGRHPGAEDIVAALALPSGKRLVPGDGNAGRRPELLLDLGGIELEELHWSVQAIDANGVGGAFTQVAVVPDLGVASPPVVPPIPEFTLEEDTAASVDIALSDGPMRADALRHSARIVDADLALVFLTRVESGPDRVLLRVQVAGKPNQSGRSELELTVTDAAGFSTVRRTMVTVKPVNDAPQFTEPSRASLIQFIGEIPAPLRFRFADSDNPIEACSAQVSVEPPSAWPDAQRRISISPEGHLEISRLDPAPATPMTVTVTVSDGIAVSEPRTVQIQPAQRLLAGPVEITSEPAHQPAFADADGDGDLDLAWLDNSGTLRLLRNEGSARWAAQSEAIVVGQTSFRWGDIDGDGRIDLVAESADGRTFTTIFNRTNRWEAFPRNAGAQLGLSQWGDLDHDGRPDLVGIEISETPMSQLVLVTATGRSSLLRIRNEALSLHPGDWDSDGSPDLLVFRPAIGWSWVHRPTPDAAWQELALPWAPGLGEIPWLGDFDQDGALDGFLGTSLWSRVPLPNASARRQSLSPPGVTLGVLNLDGRGPGWLGWSDIGSLHWSRPGEFGPPVEATPIALFRAVAEPTIADVDGDGTPDLVALLLTNPPGDTEASLQFLRNPRPPQPAPPAPNPLAPRFFNGVARLTWETPVQGTSGALRYRVRVGTTPENANVVSPDAAPSGQRLVPTPANDGFATAYDVHGLVPGLLYFWSVQAISPDGRGGPFSEPLPFRLPSEELHLTRPGALQVGAEDPELVLELGPGLPANLVFESRAQPALLFESIVPSVEPLDAGALRLRYRLRPRVSGLADLRITAVDPSGCAAILDTTVVRAPTTEGVRIVARVTAYLGSDGVARFNPELPGIPELAGNPTFRTDHPGDLSTDGGGFRWKPTSRDLNGAVPRLTLEYTDSSDRRYLSIIRILDQPAPLALIPAGPDAFVLRIADSPSLGGTLESSSDLQIWTPDSSYRMTDSGYLDIPRKPGSEGFRFYRVSTH